MLAVVANPVVRSLGMYGAAQPTGVAVTVVVTVALGVKVRPLFRQSPCESMSFAHL